MPKKKPIKIGKVELTDHQREVIAANVDTEFFKIVEEIIIPQRINQIALTLLHAGKTEKSLFYYKGMASLATWFSDFIRGEAKEFEGIDYGNDDEPSADDDVV